MKNFALIHGNSAFASKQRIIQESKQQKLQFARKLKSQNKIFDAIQVYHKVIFLSQKPQYLIQLAQIYQNQLYDVSSAILFYRRAFHLMKTKNINGSQSLIVKEKLKQLVKIKGIQLLQLGSCKNILQGISIQSHRLQIIEQFQKIYPIFHQKLIGTYVRNLNINNIKFIQSPIKDYLQTALAYLQVNHRDFAFGQIQNCLMIDQKNVDIIILKAFLYWALLEHKKAYKQFWSAYKVNPNHQQVALFLRLIIPQVQELYKEAKYDLIENNLDKCKLKVFKGLQIHPYHTDLLVLKAFLHRQKQQYKQALQDLQIANQNLQNQQKKQELKAQISLTYNQMAIFLFKQQKYNQSIDLFTQGLNFKPNDWGIYTNRGDCYRALNQFVKALQDYLSAYQLQKKNKQLNFRISTIYSLRGISLFNSKNYELALKQFEQSLKFSGKVEQFIINKAKCLIQLQRKRQAIDLLNQCLKQNKNLKQLSSFLQQIKQPQQKRGLNNRKIIQLAKQKS